MGKLIDLQIGLGISGIFDPVNRSLSPVLASALAMVAVVVYFGAEAHHALFRGIAFSLEQMPLGQFPSIVDLVPVIKQMGLMFSLGLALIAPVFVEQEFRRSFALSFRL